MLSPAAVIVLGIETSSPRGSVALVQQGRLIGECAHEEPNRHAEALLPLIDALLAQHGHTRHALQLVAVGLGPGTFTGLRVGIALASGIALGLGIPVVGVPSLTALAHGLASSAAFQGNTAAPSLIGALLDARRGECFFAAFEQDFTPAIAPCVIPIDGVESEIAARLNARSICIAGNMALQQLPSGWLPVAINDRSLEPSALFPSASSVALLAHTRHAISDMGPHYLRDADAKHPNLPPNPLRSPR